MNLPAPFLYPSKPHERRHGPSGYDKYQSFKPWLRDEFVFRCVYCLEREMWYPNRDASFSADHVIPRSEDPSRICEYENLVYACNRCNSGRQNVRVLDPTQSAFGDHLTVEEDGTIKALTVEGQDLIDLLRLAVKPALEVRQYRLRILRLRSTYPDDPQVHQLFIQEFGYPSDLPDLASLRPPGKNAKTDSEKSCYFELRKAGKLAETY